MASANVLIAFYSRDGSVEKMANAVAEGAKAAGAEVRLRRVRDILGPEVMAKVPGWAENSARMQASYPQPTEQDAEWATRSFLARPRGSETVPRS